MPLRVQEFTSSFLGGMLGPQARGRLDSDIYRSAAFDLLNGLVTRAGGVRSRGGLAVVGSMPTTARVFSMRLGAGVEYLVALRHQAASVYDASNGQLLGEYTHDVSEPMLPVYLPQQEAELPYLSIEVAGNTAFVAHPSFAPMMIACTGPTQWAFQAFAYDLAKIDYPEIWPYMRLAPSGVDLEVQSVVDETNSWKLVLQTARPRHVTSDTPNYDYPENVMYRYAKYQADNGLSGLASLGCMLKIVVALDPTKPDELRTFYGEIISCANVRVTQGYAYIDMSRATVEFKKSIYGNRPAALAAGFRIAEYYEAAYAPLMSVYSFGYYRKPVTQFPAVVAQHQGRLWFGGGSLTPDLVYGSTVTSFFNFSLGQSRDGDAVAVRLAGERAAIVRHMLGGKSLLVAGDADCWLLEGEETGAPITPTALRVWYGGPYGSSIARPLAFEDGFVVGEQSAGVIRALRRRGPQRDVEVDDISIPISGLLGEAQRLAFVMPSSTRSESYLAVLDDRGQLWMAYASGAQGVVAWSRCETNGTIEDIVSSGRDLFLLVRRGAVRSLERLDDEYWFDRSAKTTLGTRSIGSARAAGPAVARVAGEYVGTVSVAANGSVSLPDAVLGPLLERHGPNASLEVGDAFAFRIEMSAPPVPLPTGPARTFTARMWDVRILLDASFGVNVNGVDVPVPGAALVDLPEVWSGWLRIGSLGIAKEPNDERLCPRIGRVVPAPTHVVSVSRRVSVPGVR